MSELRPILRDLPRPPSIEPGPAPMLQWIDIELLVVDESYQRELRADNMKAIRRIAERFDWSKFSTVHVAPIEGGRFAIIDGQHRTHAAAACGFSQVPCQVTPMDRTRQAAAFAAINGLVTRVTAWQIYKAALTAREPWAIELDEIASAAGCKIGRNATPAADKQAGQIYSITYLRKAIATHGAERTQKTLTVLREAEGTGDTVELWSFAYFKPLFEAIASRPRCLKNSDGLKASLAAMDVWALESEAENMVAQRRRAGQPFVSKIEILESLIGDALDRAMPERMALPAPKAA